MRPYYGPNDEDESSETYSNNENGYWTKDENGMYRWCNDVEDIEDDEDMEDEAYIPDE